MYENFCTAARLCFNGYTDFNSAIVERPRTAKYRIPKSETLHAWSVKDIRGNTANPVRVEWRFNLRDDTYVVYPGELGPRRISPDVTLEVDVVALLDVLRTQRRSKVQRHDWRICNQISLGAIRPKGKKVGTMLDGNGRGAEGKVDTPFVRRPG